MSDASISQKPPSNFRFSDVVLLKRCDGVLAQDGFSLEDPPTGGRSRAIVLVWNKVAVRWMEAFASLPLSLKSKA